MVNIKYDKVKGSFFVVAFFTIWSVLIYSNTFSSSFQYDDYYTIVEPTYVHWDNVSWENFKKLLIPEHGRPVAYLTFALNYYFGGLDVRGYHYVNIGIHILTATGLFLFLKTLIELPRFSEEMRQRSHIIAFVASLLWLSSPLQTQAVTYIVQRMASLAAMFYIYAIYFYLKGRLDIGSRRHLFYLLSCGFTILAFGTKQNTYTLPIYMILLEIMVIRGGDIRALFNKRVLVSISLFLFSFGALLAYMYYSYYMPVTETGQWFIYQIETRILTGCRIIIFYILQLLFPVPSRLSLEHDFQLSRGLFDPPASLFAVLAVSGSVIYAILSWKKKPLFSFFTLWFFGNIALETFYPYLIFVFEHRLYLPSMGIFAITAVGFNNLIDSLEKKGLKWLSVLCLTTVIVSFSANTYLRNFVWKDVYSLWSDVVVKNPNLADGYVGLGGAYMKDEDYGEALNYYMRARAIDPRNPLALYGTGVSNFMLHNYDDAINAFSAFGSLGRISLDNRPSISYFFSRIAKNYYGHGRPKEALDVLNNALLYDPDESRLKELKEKMEKRTLTSEEIMKDDWNY